MQDREATPLFRISERSASTAASPISSEDGGLACLATGTAPSSRFLFAETLFFISLVISIDIERFSIVDCAFCGGGLQSDAMARRGAFGRVFPKINIGNELIELLLGGIQGSGRVGGIHFTGPGHAANLLNSP